MAENSDVLERAADAALALGAERPWREVALRDVAEAAGLTMAEVYAVARSKDDLVDAVLARFDRLAESELEPSGGAPARERIFDAAMARFDVMETRRAGAVALIKDALGDPLRAARLWRRTLRSARWLLELAGVDTSGAKGAGRVHGFALVLARATRAWLADDGGDLSKTMATLDRALRDAETWLERFAAAGRRRRTADAPAGD